MQALRSDDGFSVNLISAYYIYMEVCQVSIYLAYFASVYIGASMFYLLRTKMFQDIGTPFNDSLTPEQVIIKKLSANTRRSVFIQGIVATAVLLLLLRPFKTCVRS